ncbi:hypothetical protein AYW79_01505 [Ferroacidibacillus organovorans]|uniref:Osmotically inducible protein OsmC n=2 Tax=Ferroacidibacillus organovorans TaxID=1765683 RepID=A0A162U2T4_9BACL|nr:hypothetical protein AYJ22_00905 [Ferroacidibacillus organovorans]OAG95144.1 hypothetical protein AYW79_01505 [Ferroacidibacillus organovorans]OPG15134.1 hypothetical protein B2M26_13360 [Ferroacidibacillus organovorans]
MEADHSMADLTFKADLKWRGVGKEGEGAATIAKDITVRYSAPSEMGGKGVGTSPEELLIAAVAACYSGTLFRMLQKRGLAVNDLQIRAVGTVTGYPLNGKFAKLTVNPRIYGGDTSQRVDYQQVAEAARDACFIGKAIIGNVEYLVGDVTFADE